MSDSYFGSQTTADAAPAGADAVDAAPAAGDAGGPGFADPFDSLAPADETADMAGPRDGSPDAAGYDPVAFLDDGQPDRPLIVDGVIGGRRPVDDGVPPPGSGPPLMVDGVIGGRPPVEEEEAAPSRDDHSSTADGVTDGDPDDFGDNDVMRP